VAKKSESGTSVLQLVGEQLRNAAAKLGLSQNQVSKLSGVSRKHVGVAFSGGNISLGILAKLLPVLKIESLAFGNVSLISEHPAVDRRLVTHATKALERAAQAVDDARALLRQEPSRESPQPRKRTRR
jgi:transcriptional regulator with XRE-family HTH domain